MNGSNMFSVWSVRWRTYVKGSHYTWLKIDDTLLFLPFSCKMTVSVLSQARGKEHHSDTLYSEDSGSQPCAEVAAQILGHCTVWSTAEYVIFFFSFFFFIGLCSLPLCNSPTTQSLVRTINFHTLVLWVATKSGRVVEPTVGIWSTCWPEEDNTALFSSV